MAGHGKINTFLKENNTNRLYWLETRRGAMTVEKFSKCFHAEAARAKSLFSSIACYSSGEGLYEMPPQNCREPNSVNQRLGPAPVESRGLV